MSETKSINIGDFTLTELDSPKGKLQQASAKLFKEKGYSRTTVRDIAAAVGIQSGSIFHHFKNKEQILKTVIIDAIVRVLLEMKSALASSSQIEDKIRSLVISELAAIHNEELDGFRLMVSEWRSLNEANQQEILALREQYEGVWHSVLDEAYQSSAVTIESFYLRSFIRGALIETSNWFKASGSMSIEQLADKLIAVCIHKHS